MNYDILKYNIESLTIEINNGKILSVKKSQIEKKGARIFKNNKIFSGSYVGEIDDLNLVKHVEENAKVGLDYQFELPPVKEFHYENPKFKNLDIQTLSHDLKLMEKALEPHRQNFIFNGTMKLSKVSKELKDSRGSRLVNNDVNYDTWYTFKRVGSANLMDGYFSASGSKFDLLNTFKRIEPFLNKYDQEIHIENGDYPLVFVDSDSSWFYKLLETFNAEKYFEGSCLYAGKMGEQIFSDKFSLYDETENIENDVHIYFDEEGVLRNEAALSLIENGKLKNLVADLRLATKYKLQPTGNGKRTYNSSVATGFNHLRFKAGERKFDSILQSLDKCIIAFMAHGGDFTDKGEFSTPIHLGFLVEKGNIVGRIPQVTVTTSLDKIFNHQLIDFSADSFYPGEANVNLFHIANILNN